MKNIRRLSESQNHRCCYCGYPTVLHQHQQGKRMPKNAVTRDHVLQKTFGGKNQNNLVAACYLCNGLRGDMDAIAFYNLIQKWFRRDPILYSSWHDMSKDTYRQLQRKCLLTQERRLRGLAKQSVEHAFRHISLLSQHGHQLET